MFASMLGGLLVGLQLTRMNPFRGIELLSPGRWRMIHTNAIAYGFLANAFLGMLHWAVPRLTLKPVFDRRLSYAIFFAWQAVVVATAVGILLGEAQGLEWGETPVWIDPIALAGLLLVAINFGAPIARTSGPLYVTLWYFLAAFVWTFLTYAMGNFIPQYFVSGTSAGAVGGLFIHDLVGLFVTPLGWGMVYYFVPIMLKKPIWSHGLSLVGFWGLAFFYPLTGIHHFLYTPIPMFLQYGAIISTIAVELVVTTVIINFIATMRGSTEALVTQPADSLALYRHGLLLSDVPAVCLPDNPHISGAHPFHGLGRRACSYGDVWSFRHVAPGGDDVLDSAALKAPWYSQQLLEWHYWLSAIGILVMSADLITLGVFQGLSWSSLMPWDVSIELSIPYWLVRLVAGLFMFTGLIVFIFNIVATWASARVSQRELAVSA